MNRAWLKRGLLALVPLTMLLIVIAVVNGSAKEEPAPNALALHIDEQAVENGDMIFRRGVGLASEFVVSVDQASRFSHVGIICKQAGQPYVIHILPDEGRGADDTVRMEPLALFLSPGNASSFAVCRLSGKHREVAQRAASQALAFWKKQVCYDYDLDASNAQRLYCSELVWQAYKMAGIDLTDGVLQRVTIPFYQGRYVLISRLLNSRWLETLQQQ